MSGAAAWFGNFWAEAITRVARFLKSSVGGRQAQPQAGAGVGDDLLRWYRDLYAHSIFPPLRHPGYNRGMSDEHKRPRLAFWFAVVVFTVLPAYRIDLVGWFIDSLIDGFGAWAWVAILVIWLRFMLGIAAFSTKGVRNLYIRFLTPFVRFVRSYDLADQIVLAVRDQKIVLPAGIAALQTKNKAETLVQLNSRQAGDLEGGRRLFFHVNGPGCSKCHTLNGRGGRVGPDLSRIGVSMNRNQLIQSILEPSREIAPQYVSWAFETTGGKVLTGMIVHENEGITIIGDADGKTTELKTIDIALRVPQAKSIMPDKLSDLMTLQELRDLIAFLESLK